MKKTSWSKANSMVPNSNSHRRTAKFWKRHRNRLRRQESRDLVAGRKEIDIVEKTTNAWDIT